MTKLRTANQVKCDALRAETLRLLEDLPANMQANFQRIFPKGIGASSEAILVSAYELVVRSVEKAAAGGAR